MNEAIVVVYTEKQTYQFGTTKEINEVFGNKDGVTAQIEIDSTDRDNDHRAEQVNFNVAINGVDPKEIKSVMIL